MPTEAGTLAPSLTLCIKFTLNPDPYKPKRLVPIILFPAQSQPHSKGRPPALGFGFRTFQVSLKLGQCSRPAFFDRISAANSSIAFRACAFCSVKSLRVMRATLLRLLVNNFS
jgi:hypothetical protein